MRSLLLMAFIAVLLMSRTEPPPRAFEKQVVTIHTGDTIWSIASRYNGDTYILEYLETLKSLPENKQILNPQRALQPGDKITVLRAKGA